MLKKHCRCFLFTLIAVPLAAQCLAADYPTRPVRVLVGFPAGSGTDMLARFVGAKLTERFGQQVVVDNRPGANGIIAADVAAHAAADGYTLLAMSISHTMNAAVYKLPFDPVKSFTPVTQLGAGPLVLVANPGFAANSANTVKALIDLAHAKPDTVTYAVSGVGGINHFAGGLFARIAKIRLSNVPYKGGAQALTDLVGGQVQIMFSTAAIAMGPIRSGRIKPLGVSTRERSPLLPDVPTIAESGVPGYEMHTWWGVLGPAGLPPAVTARLTGDIAAVLAQPEFARRLEAEGAVPAPLAGPAFTRMMEEEVDNWKRVARDSQIRVE